MHTWFHVQLDQKILDGLYPSYHSYVLLCSLRNAVRTRLAGDDGSLLPEHGLIFSPKTAKFGTFRGRGTRTLPMSPLGKTSTWPFTTASPPQVIATVHRVQSYITAAMMRRQWWGGGGSASAVSATGWLHDRAIRWTCQQMDRFVKLVRLLLKRALNYIEL